MRIFARFTSALAFALLSIGCGPTADEGDELYGDLSSAYNVSAIPPSYVDEAPLSSNADCDPAYLWGDSNGAASNTYGWTSGVCANEPDPKMRTFCYLDEAIAKWQGPNVSHVELQQVGGQYLAPVVVPTGGIASHCRAVGMDFVTYDGEAPYMYYRAQKTNAADPYVAAVCPWKQGQPSLVTSSGWKTYATVAGATNLHGYRRGYCTTLYGGYTMKAFPDAQTYAEIYAYDPGPCAACLKVAIK